MTALINHRHTIWKLLPRWARGFNLFSVLYACATILDALGDALLAAAKFRFPGLYSSESLKRTGVERRLFQGPNETDLAFGVHLGIWWDVAKREAHTKTMLQEIQHYCAPSPFKVQLVTNSGALFTLDIDGTYTSEWIDPMWDWDGDSSKVSRFWVLIYPTELPIEEFNTTIDPGDGSVILQPMRDVGASTPYLNKSRSPVPDHIAIRRILEMHRAPHTHCDLIIVVLDSVAFWSWPRDGTWDQWANRSNDALYWEGTPTS
jgi:hypothetical protein